MPKQKRITRIQYEAYLDNLSPVYGDEKWIIGGVLRMELMVKKKYGLAIHKYDPIGFEVGFNEWIQNN